ncbi:MULTISPECIES: FAD/NAD(P)-binding protein [Brachybacterium]|uniref:DNA-binding protein n=3 Tax=Brachybacterium TaxID=43668 RepID=A0A3R8SBT4_9MICO|nr:MULTISPECIES: FAD/NAD(P)-binding protein [Brachybacterium]RRR17248.1 DNA-binding protein [Brachybacterium paraconglomeratum]GLI29405.1 DNA-binding protein [Brachybacterium conglomeratum]GLK06044.1 DNA-binding protein [Brachybacterium conglomeratum]
MNSRHSAPTPTSADDTRRGAPSRLVMVGGGPRAIGVLERLGANAGVPGPAERLAQAPLHVDIVDPHMPGAGRIWRAEESPLLLMNSRAADVSIFTDETVEAEGPVVAGPSLAEWADGIRRGTIAAPTAGTTRLAEIHALGPTDFASRRVQALYLEWFFGQVLAALPSTVSVTAHRTTATAVRAGDGPATWNVELEDRAPLPADLLLLAAGHTDSRPNAARHELAAFARRHGGTYLGPSQASDAQVELLGAGQDVIVRGMGLAFIDLMALLTEGRGGRFVPASEAESAGADAAADLRGRLDYLPSGEEPRLWAGSRRGVPYHSKVRDEGAPTGLGELVHVTPANLRALEDENGLLDFRTDVLPLIAAEIAHQVPGAPLPQEGEEPLAWLDEPLSDLGATTLPEFAEQATRDAVVGHIEADLRDRIGDEVTAARTLFQLLLQLHGVLVDQLPATRLRGGAASGYPRWWHSLFSFVDSGPPPHRLQQLLALERAGIIRFLGPGLRVTADEVSGRFRARGATGIEVAAGALVDAFLPEPSLQESTNPLLRDLVTGGDAALGRESAASPGALDTDARHRVIGPDGTARERLWAVGPWTSELPIAAFARPNTNAPCHRRNDALARELLETALRGHAPRPEAEEPGGGEADGGTPVLAPVAVRAPHTPRLGVLGPGKIGSALTRTALRRGLEVAVTGRSAPPALAAKLPGALHVGLPDLAVTSDVIALTLPLHVVLSLEAGALQGAVVVDATNPWGEADATAVDAARAELGDHAGELSTSELLAARLPGAHVVKTLNHIGYHDVEEHGRDHGDPSRRAIALAADDDRAAELVTTLLHRLGYEPVHLGALAAGRDLEPGEALFSGWSTSEELGLRRAEQVRAA